MTFLELAEKTLLNEKQPLTTDEIWLKAVALGFDKVLKSKGKTPENTMSAQVYVDSKDNVNTIFDRIGKRPAKFWIKGLSFNQPQVEPEIVVELKPKFHERDLHSLLVKFVDSSTHFRGAKLKTIFHEKSKKQKKGYNPPFPTPIFKNSI